MINHYISTYIDLVFDNIEEEDDFYSIITTIKTSFNTRNITSYAQEIRALLKLTEAKDLVEERDFDFKSGIPRGAIRLGRKLDEAISVGGVVVDKALINDFITKQLDEYFDGYKKNPILIINPDKTNFYDFTIDDFTMENYNPIKPQLKLELGI
jgi:hypothetical protein